MSQEWKVVPVEPTTEMRDAINGLLAAYDDGSDITPSYFMKMLLNACPAPTAFTENQTAANIQAALDYSRSFATAKPNIGLTEKEHIEGLANLLERTALENSGLQQRLTAADELNDTTKAELAWQESDNAELRKREDVLEGLLRNASAWIKRNSCHGTDAIELWERIDSALKPAGGGGDDA